MKYTLLILALVSANATATGPRIEENGNAITLCRGARPVYETQLRSRPLAIVNEGTASSFINCGFRYTVNSFGAEQFGGRLHNYRPTPVTVTCTGVFGKEGEPNTRYLNRVVTIPAMLGSSPGNTLLLFTYTADNNGNRFTTNLAFQCLMATNTSIGELPLVYRGQ